MNTPPPMPFSKGSDKVKPIQRSVFKESRSFSVGTSFDYRLIERSHQQAEAWINQHPMIEIVQIQTFDCSVHAITVVWYR